MDALLFAGRFSLDRFALPVRRRSSARIAAVTAVSLVLAAAVCLAQDPAPPPAAPVVALAEAQVPEGLEDPGPLAKTVADAVAAALRESGCEVVPPEEFALAWRTRLEEARGYFDIVSGRPDLAKRRALRIAALGEIQDRHGARVVLQPELVVVAADYFDGKAAWDGARESAAASGSGEVPALSLVLRVEDLAGRETVSPRAGIQLLAKYSRWSSKYGPVPREKLLADAAGLREAVHRALQPVLEALREVPDAAETEEPAGDEAAVEAAPVEIEPPPEGARVAALRAMRLPDEEDIAVPPEVQERYAGLLRERLEAAGWWLLPPEAYEATFDATAREFGGIYDPVTGKGDPRKQVEATEEARSRLAERYGAEAFVTGGIVVRSAGFRGETAAWDGVTEQVTDIGKLKKLLTSTLGTSPALSFGVLVEGVDGTVRHIGWGGIQLTERVERGRFVNVPPESLFADPARDERAVELALQGWVEEPAAAEPASEE